MVIGQYKSQGLLDKLYDAVNDDEDHVKLSVYSPPNLARPTFKDATSHEFKPTKRESFLDRLVDPLVQDQAHSPQTHAESRAP